MKFYRLRQSTSMPPLQGLPLSTAFDPASAASYETPIRISLREVSLDASVKFAACLTHGLQRMGTAHCLNAECDGAIIKTTANCGAALRRIRQVEIGFDVWIDAICINQSNDDEKSLQIH